MLAKEPKLFVRKINSQYTLNNFTIQINDKEYISNNRNF